jgi:hypothetical protein
MEIEKAHAAYSDLVREQAETAAELELSKKREERLLAQVASKNEVIGDLRDDNSLLRGENIVLMRKVIDRDDEILELEKKEFHSNPLNRSAVAKM